MDDRSIKQAVFLYNKEAGRGKVAYRVHKILNILRSAGYRAEAENIRFDNDEQLSKLFERFDRLDLVVVAGGDGTVNFVVNEMKTCGVDAALGVIPVGTANDFAFALGMDRNPLCAARQIADGVEEKVDCGYVNGLYFVNIFSFGIFTTTSQRTPNKLKHKIGRFAYIVQAMRDLKNLHNIDLTVIANDRQMKIKSLMVLVLNGATAGGFRLAHRSNVRDGMLDCLILENQTLLLSTLAMLRLIFGGNPSAVHQIRANHIQLLSDDNEPTDADGERGVDFPLNIECLSGELRIISARGKEAGIPSPHARNI